MIQNNQNKALSEFALEVHDLKAGYNSRVVLDNVAFSVAPAEIRVVLGVSGCGKSTLLNTILGLQKAMDGEVSFFGDMVKLTEMQIPRTTRERCGVLFQNGALLSSLTLAANVALPLRMYQPDLSINVVDEIVAQKLESVGMLDAWYKYPAELSGGMCKRAGLARALVLDPGLLFCDEPSAGLDPVTSRDLDDLLLRLREQLGIAMLIVTHELASIRSIADNLLFLSAGKVQFDGSLAQGLESTDPELVRFFNRAATSVTNANTNVVFSIEEGEHGNHQG